MCVKFAVLCRFAVGFGCKEHLARPIGLEFGRELYFSSLEHSFVGEYILLGMLHLGYVIPTPSSRCSIANHVDGRIRFTAFTSDGDCEFFHIALYRVVACGGD